MKSIYEMTAEEFDEFISGGEEPYCERHRCKNCFFYKDCICNCYHPTAPVYCSSFLSKKKYARWEYEHYATLWGADN